MDQGRNIDRGHLTLAEDTREELIRGILRGLPVAAAIAVPDGHVAITRADAVAAGLDTLAVSRWLQPHGGFGNVAYLRLPSHKRADGTCRPALHPVPYFSVPVAALALPASEAGSARDERVA
jgi:hypothetical protein